MEETKEERVEYKIYQLVCNVTGEVYFGKTRKTLEHRLKQHFNSFDCSSRQIIERGDYYIEEINSTSNIEESIKLERFYIETFDCINAKVPGRNNLEYREANRDHLCEVSKKYYQDHKDIIYIKIKEYRKNNPELRKVKYICECGSNIRKEAKARHEQSQKHINFINSKKEEE